MPLIGLLVALVAVLALWTRFLPLRSTPQSATETPAQSLKKAHEAAAQMEVLQNRRAEQLDAVGEQR